MLRTAVISTTLLAACGGSTPPPSEPPPSPPPSAKSDEPPGEVELQAAMKAARANDLEAAIDRSKAAIAANPQLEQAYLLYGSSCAMKEDPCELEAYQKGLEALPASAALKKAMALVHLQKNQMDQAISMLEELDDGRDAEVMADLAYAYIFVDRVDDGEKLATKALEIDPKCFQCNMTLGQIHLAKKNFDGAIQAYDRASQLVPDDPGPKRKMAQATYLAGKKTEALELYTAELSKYGEDDELRFEYAKALLGAKKAKEAAAEIQKLLAKNADEPNLLKMLLKAQTEAKDKKGAQKTKARLKKLGVK